MFGQQWLLAMRILASRYLACEAATGDGGADRSLAPATLAHKLLTDPDGNEYVTNTVHGSLNCTGNSPAAQGGDSEGLPNQVTGVKTGQCVGL
jgi:hypothetical protein